MPNTSDRWPEASDSTVCESLPFVAKREIHFQLVLWCLFWSAKINNKHFHHSIGALISSVSTQFLIETGPTMCTQYDWRKQPIHLSTMWEGIHTKWLLGKAFENAYWWKTVHLFPAMWLQKLTSRSFKNSSKKPCCSQSNYKCTFDIWRHIKESTLVINHPAAPSMTSDADHQVVWRCIKEYNTLVINHPAAPSVITSENGWVIWGTMKKLRIYLRK